VCFNRTMYYFTDIRPFKCKYCEYYARTNSQLKVHMMRHQGTIFNQFEVRFMMYNATGTFNNISVILWQSVLLVEEKGEPGKNH
jgi:hypothetical protein